MSQFNGPIDLKSKRHSCLHICLIMTHSANLLHADLCLDQRAVKKVCFAVILVLLGALNRLDCLFRWTHDGSLQLVTLHISQTSTAVRSSMSAEHNRLNFTFAKFKAMGHIPNLLVPAVLITVTLICFALQKQLCRSC